VEKETKKSESGEAYEGHGDSTAPKGFQSPGTFVPLSQQPTSADVKDKIGKKGDLNRG
jgi:hypothetical protein